MPARGFVGTHSGSARARRGDCGHDRIADPARRAAGRPRALGRARRQRARHRRRLRRRRPRRGRRRRRLPRLRRRHRLPEPRPQPRGGGRAPIHAQVDPTCTSASWSPPTSPTSTSAGASASSRPAAATDQKSLLLNSGAEAVENAVKIARATTGRPAIVAFDRGFHGRTLMTMTLTSKVKPYKKGFGPFAPEVYRAPAPYPYRGISSDDAIAALEQLFVAHVDPATVAAVILEPVQGEGGFIPMPADFPAQLRELCDRHGILWIDDEVQAGVGRTGPMWAIEHYDAQPDLLVSRQVARRRAAAGRGDRARGDHGRGRPGRARRHVRRQPGVLRGGQRRARGRCPAMQRGVRGAGHADACGAGGHRHARGRDRRGARARPDARARDRARPRDEDAGARASSAAAIAAAREQGLLLLGLRPARQRHPAAAAADDHRRGPRRAGSRSSKRRSCE